MRELPELFSLWRLREPSPAFLTVTSLSLHEGQSRPKLLENASHVQHHHFRPDARPRRHPRGRTRRRGGPSASCTTASPPSAFVSRPRTVIFVDEAEEHLPLERHTPDPRSPSTARASMSGTARRSRSRCISMTRRRSTNFAPGARVRAVKQWAVAKFELPPKDAADHVLQLCGTSARPATDTALHQLVHGHDCVLCFDLVPRKARRGLMG